MKGTTESQSGRVLLAKPSAISFHGRDSTSTAGGELTFTRLVAEMTSCLWFSSIEKACTTLPKKSNRWLEIEGVGRMISRCDWQTTCPLVCGVSMTTLWHTLTGS